MIVLLVIGFGILGFASYWWIKLIWFIFPSKAKEENPYILYQKKLNMNDKYYEEYINWFHENQKNILHSSGVPIDKIMSEEEERATTEIKKALK